MYISSEVGAMLWNSSGSVRFIRGRMRHSKWVDLSMNGVYPVDAFTVFIMLKQTFGNALAHPA